MGESEKRQSKRVVNHDLQVRYFFASDTRPVQVFVENLSTGGMRIHNPFKIDERYQFPMDIVLDAESDTVMKAIARVTWQRKKETGDGWEMGLEFVHLEDYDRELLAKFVEELGK